MIGRRDDFLRTHSYEIASINTVPAFFLVLFPFSLYNPNNPPDQNGSAPLQEKSRRIRVRGGSCRQVTNLIPRVSLEFGGLRSGSDQVVQFCAGQYGISVPGAINN